MAVMEECNMNTNEVSFKDLNFNNDDLLDIEDHINQLSLNGILDPKNEEQNVNDLPEFKQFSYKKLKNE